MAMMPMIDVVFLLLIFFVWTSSFDPIEYNLPSPLAVPPEDPNSESVGSTPQTQVEPVESFDEVLVRIENGDDRTELLLWNGQAVNDRKALRDRVRQVVELGIQPPVILHPDDDVSVRQSIAVFDLIRSAGADRVLFAVPEK